jgi:hypothetical protein
MGKFRLFDPVKRKEASSLSEIVSGQTKKFDCWVLEWEYDEGSSPPNPEQASLLELEKIASLLQEFDELVKDKQRVQSQWPWRRKRLAEELQKRKGALYKKCSTSLRESATASMKYCMETYADFGQGIDLMMVDNKAAPSEIDIVFANIIENCNHHVDRNFPGGVQAFENYIPDESSPYPNSFLTYGDFLKTLNDQKEEYHQKALNLPSRKLCQDGCTCCSLRNAFQQVLQAQDSNPEKFQAFWSSEPGPILSIGDGELQ